MSERTVALRTARTLQPEAERNALIYIRLLRWGRTWEVHGPPPRVNSMQNLKLIPTKPFNVFQHHRLRTTARAPCNTKSCTGRTRTDSTIAVCTRGTAALLSKFVMCGWTIWHFSMFLCRSKTGAGQYTEQSMTERMTAQDALLVCMECMPHPTSLKAMVGTLLCSRLA